MVKVASNWEDYELIDAGEGEKLERWYQYILRRPDPQAIWSKNPEVEDLWENPDMFYHRSRTGGGFWEVRNDELRDYSVKESWLIKYKELSFRVKPTGFKHTGLFPEQSVNWDWIIENIKKRDKDIKVLNLFAYTGGATVAAAYAGAEVVHVDASKGMINIAKENIKSSSLEDKNVRFIQDDVLKFVEREIRRGNKYDLVIMDPPSYGRGSKGELWEIERDLDPLIKRATELMNDDSFGFILNTYATEIAGSSFENLLKDNICKNFGGVTESFELALPISKKRFGVDLVLPTGATIRWSK